MCVPVVLETESSITHTQTDASDHEYLHDITLADAIAFQVELVLAHDWHVLAWVCVCESKQSSVMKIFNFKMATDDFSQLVCLDFSGDGYTFHDGDAFGKYGSLALLIARLEKVLHLPRSIVCSLLAKN